MKKLVITGVVIAAMSLLVVLAVPAFAHGPEEGNPGTTGGDVWERMHEACEEGDWDAMAGAAEEAHEELGYPPCHDGYGSPDPSSNGWGGMSGGHMGGWGGMMR